MKLSVCIITKNEEKNLLDCLNPIKKYTDEIIVVDTGSDDKSIEIAKNLGAKVYEFDMENDFSKARNYSIEKATGDWIFVIDADERIKEYDAKKIKEELIAAKNIGAYLFTRKNITFGNEYPEWYDYVVRLFRKFDGLKYTGKVHEKPDESFTIAGIKIYKTDIIIEHLGFLKKYKGLRKNKSEKYIDILKREIEEDKNNAELWYLIGTEYYKVKDYTNASESFRKSIEINNNSAAVYNGLGITEAEIGNINNSIESFMHSIKIEPFSSEYLYNLGTAYFKNQDYINAEKYLIKSIDIEEKAEALRLIGLIKYFNKNYKESEKYYLKSVDIDNNFGEAYINLGRLYIDMNDLQKALKYFEKALEIMPQNESVKKLILTLKKITQ